MCKNPDEPDLRNLVGLEIKALLGDMIVAALMGLVTKSRMRERLDESMGKLRILGAMLCAVFAFGAVMATGASALEWLVKGVARETASETEGEVELIFYNRGVLTEKLTVILCSGIFDGKIGQGAGRNLDEVTEVLNLLEEPVGKDQLLGNGENSLEGKPLICSVTFDGGSLEDCKEGLEAAEVWPANLPWKTELELMAGNDILDKFVGNVGEPGWEVECTALIGIKGSNLCEAMPGTATMLLENAPAEVPPAVLGFFEEPTMEEMADCTLAGELSAEFISEGSANTWGVIGGKREETSIS